MATLFGSMANELKNRPHVHPNVDDGFAAVAKAGVKVPAPAQSLATTYKASYCSHGVTTGKDLSILFCEYSTEALAAAGFDVAKSVFPGAKDRHVFFRKTLMMVVMKQNDSQPAATDASIKQAVAAFNAL